MGSRFLLRGFNIARLSPKLLGVLFLGALLSGAGAAAQPAQSLKLLPYTAYYTTTTRGMEFKLTRRLQERAGGRYVLSNKGKILVVGFQEMSVFSIEGEQIQPHSYVYQGNGLINRRREIHFIPKKNIIRSLYKDQWYDLPKTERTLDRMTQLEQLRLWLLHTPMPAEEYSLRVADGRKVKDHTVRFVAEEFLETKMGRVKTLHYERLHKDASRTSDIWLAPEWDYLMVKTVHVEDDEPVHIELNNATINGAALATAVTEP